MRVSHTQSIGSISLSSSHKGCKGCSESSWKLQRQNRLKELFFCKIYLQVWVRCVIPWTVRLAMSSTSQVCATIHLNLSIELYNQMTVCYSAKSRNRLWNHHLPRFTGASRRKLLYEASLLCVRTLISIQYREMLPFIDRGSIFIFEVNPAPSCSNT